MGSSASDIVGRNHQVAIPNHKLRAMARILSPGQQQTFKSKKKGMRRRKKGKRKGRSRRGRKRKRRRRRSKRERRRKRKRNQELFTVG